MNQTAAYFQFRTKRNAAGKLIDALGTAQFVAEKVRELGHEAKVGRGAIMTSPDQETERSVAHVITTAAGKLAYQQWNAARIAARAAA